MIKTNSISPQLDPITERRRALAKVYALLLRLAEEAERKNSSPENTNTGQEKVSEPVLTVEA